MRACRRQGQCAQTYGSIHLHTAVYVSIRQHTSANVSIRQQTSACVSTRQHMSAYVSMRQYKIRITVKMPIPVLTRQVHIYTYIYVYTIHMHTCGSQLDLGTHLQLKTLRFPRAVSCRHPSFELLISSVRRQSSRHPSWPLSREPEPNSEIRADDSS